MEPNETAPPRTCRRRSLTKTCSKENLMEDSCRSLESLGYDVLEERRPGFRKSSMDSCASFESHGCQGAEFWRQGLRRASLDRSNGTRSLTKSYSNDSLMESCRSFESIVSEITTHTRRPGQKRGSLNRSTGTRCLMNTSSSDSLMNNCRSFESNGISGNSSEALDRRRGGLRRSQVSHIILTNTVCNGGTPLDLHSSRHGGAERRSSLDSVSSTISLHRRVAKRSDIRHNSISTLSTTRTIVDEVEAMIEDAKQAIRQKVARQATLRSHIESGRELAKARYLSENERGALLSMRRIHKFSAQMDKVSATCTELVQLQRRLEQAVRSKDALDSLDLTEMQTTLENAFDIVEDEGHKMPSDDELRDHLRILSGMIEI